MTDKRIEYTDAGSKQLKVATDKCAAMLEAYIVERKYVPGDEFIEITGADIEKASQRLSIRRPPSKSMLRRLIILIYAGFGGLLTSAAIFWPYLQNIREMFGRDPIRLMFLVSGVTLSLLALSGWILIGWRERLDDERMSHQRMEREFEANRPGDLNNGK